MPSLCHYRGDHVEQLLADKAANRLYGPDICGPARPGQVLGFGAHYEIEDATYDEKDDRTTAFFKPYVPPTDRSRIRYYGEDGGEITAEPDVIGTPKLADRDDIRGH